MAEEYLPSEVVENELEDYTFNTQVSQYNTDNTHHNTKIAGLRSIQPVPAQILSAVDSNGRPIHIELDSATTVSYITLA